MIALLLSLALAAPPLSCPPGAEHRGAAPPEGYEEWCEAPDPAARSGSSREGPSVKYYDDGRTWVEAGWRRGLLHGAFRERYRGGAVAREGSYQDGKRTGPWTVRAEDGSVVEESSWKDGLRHGPFVQYWPGGRPRTVGRHCLDVQCGRWRSFDEAGRETSSTEFEVPRGEP